MEMKRPFWVTIIGIIGIVLSILGIFGGAKDVLMPQILKKQKKMINSMGEVFDKTTIDKKSIETKNNSKKISEFAKQFEEFYDVPPWYISWIISVGIFKIILNILFFVTSIMLLSLNHNSIKLFYSYIGLTILLRAIIFGVSTFHSSFSILDERFTSIFFIALNIALVIVVVLGNKDVFRKNGFETT